MLQAAPVGLPSALGLGIALFSLLKQPWCSPSSCQEYREGSALPWGGQGQQLLSGAEILACKPLSGRAASPKVVSLPEPNLSAKS